MVLAIFLSLFTWGTIAYSKTDTTFNQFDENGLKIGIWRITGNKIEINIFSH
jgi:hypothetical protein